MPAGEVWPERSGVPGSCFPRGLLLRRFAASGSAAGGSGPNNATARVDAGAGGAGLVLAGVRSDEFELPRRRASRGRTALAGRNLVCVLDRRLSGNG
jgi:hypothetical protein